MSKNLGGRACEHGAGTAEPGTTAACAPVDRVVLSGPTLTRTARRTAQREVRRVIMHPRTACGLTVLAHTLCTANVPVQQAVRQCNKRCAKARVRLDRAPGPCAPLPAPRISGVRGPKTALRPPARSQPAVLRTMPLWVWRR